MDWGNNDFPVVLIDTKPSNDSTKKDDLAEEIEHLIQQSNTLSTHQQEIATPTSSPPTPTYANLYDYLAANGKAFLKWAEFIDNKKPTKPLWIEVLKGTAPITQKISTLTQQENVTIVIPTDKHIDQLMGKKDISIEAIEPLFLYHILNKNVEVAQKETAPQNIDSILQTNGIPEKISIRKKELVDATPPPAKTQTLINEIEIQSIPLHIGSYVVQPIKGVLIPTEYLTKQVQAINLECKKIETTETKPITSQQPKQETKDVPDSKTSSPPQTQTLKIHYEAPPQKLPESITLQNPPPKGIQECIPNQVRNSTIFPENTQIKTPTPVIEQLKPTNLLANAFPEIQTKKPTTTTPISPPTTTPTTINTPSTNKPPAVNITTTTTPTTTTPTPSLPPASQPKLSLHDIFLRSKLIQ